MKVTFSDRAWADYEHWAATDVKTLRRVNRLIDEAARTPFEGIGKPEPLKGKAYAGWWSRRITEEHRLVYRVRNDVIEVAQARFHYDD